jgi:hypothetical protein
MPLFSSSPMLDMPLPVEGNECRGEKNLKTSYRKKSWNLFDRWNKNYWWKTCGSSRALGSIVSMWVLGNN